MVLLAFSSRFYYYFLIISLTSCEQMQETNIDFYIYFLISILLCIFCNEYFCKRITRVYFCQFFCMSSLMRVHFCQFLCTSSFMLVHSCQFFCSEFFRVSTFLSVLLQESIVWVNYFMSMLIDHSYCTQVDVPTRDMLFSITSKWMLDKKVMQSKHISLFIFN